MAWHAGESIRHPVSALPPKNQAPCLSHLTHQNIFFVSFCMLSTDFGFARCSTAKISSPGVRGTEPHSPPLLGSAPPLHQLTKHFPPRLPRQQFLGIPMPVERHWSTCLFLNRTFKFIKTLYQIFRQVEWERLRGPAEITRLLQAATASKHAAASWSGSGVEQSTRASSSKASPLIHLSLGTHYPGYLHRGLLLRLLSPKTASHLLHRVGTPSGQELCT